jgi:hypothetical protein
MVKKNYRLVYLVLMISISILYASLQILLPWNILVLFLQFVLDQNKKYISILDPPPIPTLGKNIFKTIIKKLNLVFQDANPALKVDISKWRWKVPAIPTNSYGYESCQCIIILIYSFNA